MLKNRDIVVHGLQSYDSDIGSNCINIANEMAKNNRVLYVNYPVDRLTLLRHSKIPQIIRRKEVLKGKKPDLVQVNDNLWNLTPAIILESINKISSSTMFRLFNFANNKKYAREIKRAMGRISFSTPIFFNDSDFYRAFYFRELINPSLMVYYTRDNMRATSFFKKHGAGYEDILMSKSDLVVSNSVYLNDIAKKANPNSVYVGQGCDITLFNKDIISSIPNDIAKIPKPVIGYIGALKSSRLDIETIKYIAEKKPKWSVVLVGPEDNEFIKSDLHNLKNVYFTGSKNGDQLPIYLNSFDVAINPQALNDITIGNYPRKIDEYLAMGKPVVATKTITMGVFADHTYLASTKEEYVELIDKALADNNEDMEAARIDFAQSHTWENNVDEIYKAITNTEN